LLKLARGLLKLQRGSLQVLGQPVGSASTMAEAGKLDPRVAYIPQQLGLVRSLTVLDNTLIGALGYLKTLPSLLKSFPGVYVDQALETLGALGIKHKAEEKVYSLSGGERQRVAIARALMQQPLLILADEFISQLDPVSSLEIMDIVRGSASRGVGLLITSHELEIVQRYADRVVVLRDGQKVLDCPAREAIVDDLGAVIKA
jgi:phosphonate transport system ATP-binding protein